MLGLIPSRRSSNILDEGSACRTPSCDSTTPTLVPTHTAHTTTTPTQTNSHTTPTPPNKSIFAGCIPAKKILFGGCDKDCVWPQNKTTCRLSKSSKFSYYPETDKYLVSFAYQMVIFTLYTTWNIVKLQKH